MNTNSVLRLDVDKRPTTIIVHCTGKVVIESFPFFSTSVRQLIAEGKPIRVDLNDVIQVDSTGIGAFVSVWAAAKKSGCDLKFINPNDRVKDVVRITRLHQLFEDSNDAAA